MKRLPWIVAGLATAAFVVVACSGSDPVFPDATGGSAAGPDASKGGAGGSSAGAGGSSQGGAPQGGAGGTSAGGTGNGGSSNGGSSNGGSSNGGSGGTSTGGSSNGGSSNGGSGGTSTGGSSNGGSGGTSKGGAGGTSTGGSGGTSTGGSGGTGGACSGQQTTVAAIAADTLAESTLVNVTGAIATSAKFQVTNACLWGVFVKGPGSNAGAFVVSQGLVSGTTCTAGTDQIAQGIVPGDIVNFGARILHFTATGCTGVPALLEVQVNAADGCAAVKTGSGPAPAPIDVNAADLLGGLAYPNQLVRISNVTLQDLVDGGVVDKQGTITLQGTGLLVRDSIYWRIQGAPQFGSYQFFNSIVGINSQPMAANGVCSYTLLPRDKCVDYVPKSLDCP